MSDSLFRTLKKALQPYQPRRLSAKGTNVDSTASADVFERPERVATILVDAWARRWRLLLLRLALRVFAAAVLEAELPCGVL